MLRSGSNHHYRRCRRVVSLTPSAVAATSFYGILCLKTKRWIEKLSGLIAILFFVVGTTVLILLLVTGRPLKLTSIRRINYCVHTLVNRTEQSLVVPLTITTLLQEFNQKGCTINTFTPSTSTRTLTVSRNKNSAHQQLTHANLTTV